MERLWYKFFFGIISVLVLLLVFITVYETVNGEAKESSTADDRIDIVTLYDKEGNILYQCQTDNDIKTEMRDGELCVYVPHQICSCFSD